MKVTDWSRLTNAALGDGLGGEWRCKGKLVYRCPIGWVVHGLLGDDTSVRGVFQLWVVRLPLVAPTDGVIGLSWSDQFGGPHSTYDVDSDQAVQAIVAAADHVVRHQHAQSVSAKNLVGVGNPRSDEVRAYEAVLSGDIKNAVFAFERVLEWEPRTEWDEALRQRVAEVYEMVLANSIDEAVERFASWRQDNLRALDLACE